MRSIAKRALGIATAAILAGLTLSYIEPASAADASDEVSTCTLPRGSSSRRRGAPRTSNRSP